MPKKTNMEIRDLESLTREAVERAKERREQVLGEDELADVHGGAGLGRPIIMGFQMESE